MRCIKDLQEVFNLAVETTETLTVIRKVGLFWNTIERDIGFGDQKIINDGSQLVHPDFEEIHFVGRY